MSAVTANDDGLAMHVKDWKSMNLSIHTITSYDGTLKLQGSNADTKPDFTAARTAANPWYYVDAVAVDGADANVTGSTGIAFAGTDKAGSGYEVNTDGLTWFNVITSGRTAGSISVVGTCYTD